MANHDRAFGIHTTAIHAGESPDPSTGALVPPLHLATTYHLGTAENSAAIFSGEKDAFVYTRWGNPTVAAFEASISDTYLDGLNALYDRAGFGTLLRRQARRIAGSSARTAPSPQPK